MKLRFLPLAMLLGLGAVLGLAQPAAAITHNERVALVQLFDSTGGANWTSTEGWNDPVECSWFGVICDADNNLVGLDLSDNNLTGSLPALTDLAAVKFFSVANNHLVGSMSATSDLKNLRTLDVSGNQLSGPIPALTGMTSLQEFNAAGNQLSGAIPAFGALTALRVFNIASNRLTGNMPRLIGLAGLKTLDVSNNHLTGW